MPDLLSWLILCNAAHCKGLCIDLNFSPMSLEDNQVSGHSCVTVNFIMKILSVFSIDKQCFEMKMQNLRVFERDFIVINFQLVIKF